MRGARPRPAVTAAVLRLVLVGRGVVFMRGFPCVLGRAGSPRRAGAPGRGGGGGGRGRAGRGRSFVSCWWGGGSCSCGGSLAFWGGPDPHDAPVHRGGGAGHGTVI